MHHLIGYADHHSFRDPSVSPLSHYHYSDGCNRLVFESALQYHNRWLWSDYREAFERIGLETVEEKTDGGPEAVARAESIRPHLAARFRKYPIDEIARRHSIVVLRRD